LERIKNIVSDPEFWFVLVFNGFIAWGYTDKLLSLDTVVWIYYFQSVLLGIGNAVRMAFMQGFTTENFTINGQPVSSPSKAKWMSTIFFLVHYGFFHVVYLVFLMVGSFDNGSKLDFRVVMINLMVIAGNTIISVWSNILRDRDDPPSISAMFFVPYLRVVPMHIFIILGFSLSNKSLLTLPYIGLVDLFWAFLILKTIFDLLMHIVVQKSWRKRRPKPVGGYI
jgi:hypothetical protein